MNDLNDENKSDKKKEIQEDKLSIEDQLKNSEDKLLRSLAEIENQRNRYEKILKKLSTLEVLILHEKVWLF